KKPPLTHFLCIPLVTSSSRPQLETSLQRFRDELGRGGESGEVGVPEKAVRPVGTLHLTLGVMSLAGEERVREAVELLQGLNLRATKPTPHPPPPATTTSADGAVPIPVPLSPPPPQLILSLTSLYSMHPATRTSILYAAPSDPGNRLLPFCLSLQRLFTQRGFLLPDDRPLKLHATVLNTIYAKAGGRGGRARGGGGIGRGVGGGVGAGAGDAGNGAGAADGTGVDPVPDRSRGHGPNARAPLRFDARGLLERFEGFVWAEGLRVDKVAICRMGARKVLDEGGAVVGEEYEEVGWV
ncbi:uncharacterized protein K441DRAFT_457477, partial [Cenococcum geophilum 1.58]|uniref:uncharacterized protein n=1 Tax=Cenococcum geophilum 1.58 TaxID=794803 RepID=UPI00358E4602